MMRRATKRSTRAANAEEKRFMRRSNQKNIYEGEQYGEFLVIAAYFEKRYGAWFHQCKCSCGNLRVIRGAHLRSGASSSCGCIRGQLLSKSKTKHGDCGTRTYRIWKGIKGRCLNKNHKSYPRYGGAGVTVCDRWVRSYQSFLDDMGECPDGLSIDRIDSSKGYYKENCRWATFKKQAENRRILRGDTGVKGVNRHGNKYRAGICHNYKQIYLGLFETMEDAIKARRAAEIKYWGENNAASPN